MILLTFYRQLLLFSLGKPTKTSVAEVPNPNKINIESKLVPKPEEPNVITEQVHIGHTAIVHCTFNTIKQIGTYRQAKVQYITLRLFVSMSNNKSRTFVAIPRNKQHNITNSRRA